MKKSLLTLILMITSIYVSAQSDTSLLKYRYNQQINYYAYDSLPCKPYHADTIIKMARKYTGVPYATEGKTEAGFDCSGFMFFLHKPFCVFLPYFSSQFGDIGTKVDLIEAKKGDLILFKGHDLATDHTGHVGMVISAKGEPLKFIHASSSHGVREDKLKGNTYFEPRFIGLRRLVQ